MSCSVGSGRALAVNRSLFDYRTPMQWLVLMQLVELEAGVVALHCIEFSLSSCLPKKESCQLKTRVETTSRTGLSSRCAIASISILDPRRANFKIKINVKIERKGRRNDHSNRIEQLDAMQYNPNTPISNAKCWAGVQFNSISILVNSIRKKARRES